MNEENPYAAPQTPPQVPGRGVEAPATGAWRDGKLLVVGHRAALPDRCVKCNAPTHGCRRRFKLYWHSPLAFLALLLGLIPYILVAFIMTKKITVDVGVCTAHEGKRSRAVNVTILAALAGVVLIFSAAVVHTVVPVLAGIAVLLGALVYGNFAIRIVWPKRIDEELAWLNGASYDYLITLPEFGQWAELIE